MKGHLHSSLDTPYRVEEGSRSSSNFMPWQDSCARSTVRLRQHQPRFLFATEPDFRGHREFTPAEETRIQNAGRYTREKHARYEDVRVDYYPHFLRPLTFFTALSTSDRANPASRVCLRRRRFSSL